MITAQRYTLPPTYSQHPTINPFCHLISSSTLPFPPTHSQPLDARTRFYYLRIRPQTTRLPHYLATLPLLMQQISLLQPSASIIRAIVISNTNCPTIDDTVPFWWLLLHLDMLMFAPSTRKQHSDSSIQNTIRDRIDAAFSGDIAYLFNSAMNVKWLTQC